jgi:fructokinase
MPTLAAVEGGGTTFVAALGTSDPLTILERADFPTKPDPTETLNEVKEWLSTRKYDALGVACFGPVDLNVASEKWGHITTTPKEGWQNTDVMGPLLALRKVPCLFDTDVNAPALEEFRHYATGGQSSCAYVTVGTGVGIGLVVNGKMVKGLVHPEGGHIPALKRPEDNFQGLGVHPWSIEGQVCAAAIAARAGVPMDKLKEVPDDSEVWLDVAYVLGSMCATLTLLCSMERIVLSGGIMLRASLFPKIRQATRSILNGYVNHPKVLSDGPEGIDSYIVPSERGNEAGIYGALALADAALKQSHDGESQDYTSIGGITALMKSCTSR